MPGRILIIFTEYHGPFSPGAILSVTEEEGAELRTRGVAVLYKGMQGPSAHKMMLGSAAK